MYVAVPVVKDQRVTRSCRSHRLVNPSRARRYLHPIPKNTRSCVHLGPTLLSPVLKYKLRIYAKAKERATLLTFRPRIDSPTPFLISQFEYMDDALLRTGCQDVLGVARPANMGDPRIR